MLQDRPTSASRLEFTVIGDLSQPGVFDEAVKGVDAIIHTASVRISHGSLILSLTFFILSPSLTISKTANGNYLLPQ